MSHTVPVKCFSCGKVLGDLWILYNQKIQDEVPSVINEDNKHKFQKNFKGKVLDELNLKRTCCRAQMLTTVDNNINLQQKIQEDDKQ